MYCPEISKAARWLAYLPLPHVSSQAVTQTRPDVRVDPCIVQVLCSRYRSIDDDSCSFRPSAVLHNVTEANDVKNG